ncbi:MAG TPA: DUF2711 family protein [Terracidiphilus sp.]|jgi:hypothetical protein|nr:DUF2711 family protein [Terracidiphilus sp.]
MALTRLLEYPLLSCRVQAQNYTYPPYDLPLVEAYGRRFESVFILLHPFVRVPPSLSWTVTRAYPGDAQIAAHATKCRWSEVSAHIGLSSCARINQALLTSIGALDDSVADHAGHKALLAFLESHHTWMPAEGRFEPLLQPNLLSAFAMAGTDQLTFVPEFPQSDPIVTLGIDELARGSAPFPCRGTLLAPDASFLFTVDWDSFFTLFYGSRDFVRRVVTAHHLEGFFATPNTDHLWFNYSMGCATVTLSPEDWQTAASLQSRVCPLPS